MAHDDKKALAELSARKKKERADRRAQALALLAAGVSADAVAERLGLKVDSIRKWRRLAREGK